MVFKCGACSFLRVNVFKPQSTEIEPFSLVFINAQLPILDTLTNSTFCEPHFNTLFGAGLTSQQFNRATAFPGQYLAFCTLFLFVFLLPLLLQVAFSFLIHALTFPVSFELYGLGEDRWRTQNFKEG